MAKPGAVGPAPRMSGPGAEPAAVAAARNRRMFLSRPPSAVPPRAVRRRRRHAGRAASRFHGSTLAQGPSDLIGRGEAHATHGAFAGRIRTGRRTAAPSPFQPSSRSSRKCR